MARIGIDDQFSVSSEAWRQRCTDSVVMVCRLTLHDSRLNFPVITPKNWLRTTDFMLLRRWTQSTRAVDPASEL